MSLLIDRSLLNAFIQRPQMRTSVRPTALRSGTPILRPLPSRHHGFVVPCRRHQYNRLHHRSLSKVGWKIQATKFVEGEPPISPYDVDPDLWEVLELCNKEELELLYETLFSPSLFSPFVKTLVAEKEPAAIDYHGRTSVMHKIQRRFRFLAASSMDTLQGYRPTYRETLMHIKSKFNIRCPLNLETSELETEVYLHLLSHCQQFIADQPRTKDIVNTFNTGDGMSTTQQQPGLFGRILAPLRLGREEMMSMLSKLGGALTISMAREAVMEKLGMEIMTNSVKYQMALKSAYKHGLNSLKKRFALQVSVKHLANTVNDIRYPLP